MVQLFMLYHMEQKKNKVKLSIVYDSKYNDDKKSVREVYIREKILQEYLYLKNIENDKDQILKNKRICSIVTDSFFEKLSMNYKFNYEGITVIDNEELFYSQKNVFWKYYDGHCFVLMCSTDENCLMASNFLNILQIFAKPDILESPEGFAVILDALLPSGQLLYLTQKAANELVLSHTS